jgi:nicotinate-nucleotide--dimethylbenzimidazole phosphoribosyltransferase
VVIEVPLPDPTAAALARDTLAAQTAGTGDGPGRLGDLGEWLAATQGRCPPTPPRTVRLLLFGTASTTPAEHQAAALGVPVAVSRAAAGVGDQVPGRDIARADALSGHELDDAMAAGRAAVDAEVDAGADLLLIGYPAGPAAGERAGAAAVASAVIVAAMTGSEPVAVLPRGANSGCDDQTWMQRAVTVRDALRRVHREDAQWEPSRLLAMVAGADLVALTSALAQAAARRTPVLLDGPVAAGCALVAEQLAPGAVRWWQVAEVSSDPAQGIALARLGLRPLLDLGRRGGDGTGALLALPILRSAAAAVG